MTMLDATDSFDIGGFSSTTGTVCIVVGINDIEEGEVTMILTRNCTEMSYYCTLLTFRCL
jgi:hypothetical protein